MAEPLFRLDVWVPARPDKRLSYEKQEDNQFSEIQEDYLHEQAFCWKIRGDIWTSLSTNGIREKLTTGFSWDLLPSERSFEKVKEFLETLKIYLNDENNRQWQDWEPPLHQDDPDCFFQIQPLLALYQHIQWLYDVFCDVPGSSVTVR